MKGRVYDYVWTWPLDDDETFTHARGSSDTTYVHHLPHRSSRTPHPLDKLSKKKKDKRPSRTSRAAAPLLSFSMIQPSHAA